MNMMTEEMMNNEMNNNALAAMIPVCPVMLVLDTSHSMWGEGLRDLGVSLKNFYGTLNREGFAGAKIRIAAVSMGERLGMLEEFTAYENSQLPALNIRPKGDTPIGSALSLALQKLDEEISALRSRGVTLTTPQLLILSDGISSDDYSAPAQELRRRSAAGTLICRAIALGNAPDMNALAQICGSQVVFSHQGMAEAFTQVGQVVSQVYEEEAAEVITGQSVPLACNAGTTYLLDGSNIMHWDKFRSGNTLRFIKAMADYFRIHHNPYQVFFDATTRYRLDKAEVPEYERLLKIDPEHFKQVPANTCADDFLLLTAQNTPGSVILTQDLYRDHRNKYPWLNQRGRVIPGMVMSDRIFFPEISLQIPLNGAEM